MRHEAFRQYRRSPSIFCPPEEASSWSAPKLAAVVAGVAAIGLGVLMASRILTGPDTVARIPHVMASLVDISDPVDPEIRNQLATLVMSEAEQLQRGDAAQLVQLSAEPEAPITPVFEIDPVPERGIDCRFFIGCNRADLEKRFRAGVIEPYARAVDRAFLPGLRRRTPLFQGLHALTARPAYRAADPGVRKSLRVVTDGLVHTNGCSVYAIAKRAAQTKKKVSPQDALNADPGCQAEMREFPGNFRNTDVELVIIRRTKALGGDLQTHELLEWLERYFLNGGARQVRVRRIG